MKMKKLNRLSKAQLLRRLYRANSRIKLLNRTVGELPSWRDMHALRERADAQIKEALGSVDMRLRGMHGEIERAETKMRNLAADNFIMRKKLNKAGIGHA